LGPLVVGPEIRLEGGMLGFTCLRALVLAGCLALAGASGGPARAAGGLAPDGDFEASPYASYYTNGSGTFTWATDQSYSYSHSLKVVSVQAPGELARWMTNTNAIAVTPGVTYAVAAEFKTANVSSGRCWR
jgi:hypothetical protein